MERKSRKYVKDFRKSHGTQHCLMVMQEKWKKGLSKEENMSAMFIDSPKGF